MQVENSNSTAPAWASQQSGIDEVQNRASLDKDDFLKLMVTQLQNQDPLEPASNQEFAAQLAQYSSLEQMTEMNSSLQAGLANDEQLNLTLNNSAATRFIGQEVHATGNIVNLEQGQPINLRFSQAYNSDQTLIDIYNSQGALVRTIELENVQSGGIVAEWDGKDHEGNSLTGGSYYFDITATDVSGNNVGVTPYMTGKVTGIRYNDNRVALLVDGNEVALENVLEIVEPGSASAVQKEE
jgi:flagellar basal-body rod modification protein FlgD